MKKLFTLVMMMFAASASSTFAQVDETFQFMDKDGNIIADGTELVCDEAEIDDWGAVMVPTGLFVKNNSTDANVLVKLQCVIEEMSEGSSATCCFPGNCIPISGVGTYNNGPATYQSSDMQTEWFPPTNDNYEYVEGQCKASFQLFACTKKTFGSGYNEVACAKVHVTFVYSLQGDPDGIDTAVANKIQNNKCYDLQGRELQAIPERGIYIQNGKKYVK